MSISAVFTGVASNATCNVRVTFGESYNSSNNKTTLTLSKLEIQRVDNTNNFGNGLPLFGTIVVNNIVATTIDNSQGHRATLPKEGVFNDGNYHEVNIDNLTITPVVISHNDDGSGSAEITLIGGISFNVRPTNENPQGVGGGDSYFGARWPANIEGTTTGYIFGVPAGNGVSQSVSLTRASTYTLTVDPNNGTNPIVYTRASGAQVLIYFPVRSGYTFNGWTKTGGGSVSPLDSNGRCTYTFGTSNGTLTANWTAIQNTVSVYVGAGTKITINSTEYTPGTYTFTSTSGTSLSIVFSALTGYDVSSRQINGNSVAASVTYSVSGDTVIQSLGTLKKYTITINSNPNATITVKNGNTVVTSGQQIDYGTVLTVIMTPRIGYQIDTRTPSGNQVTVTSNLTIQCTVSPMATIHKRVNGSWVTYLIYIRRNGAWALHQANIRTGGSWRQYY